MYDKTFQVKVWPVIISVFNDYLAPVYSGKLSKDVAISKSAFPYGIYQSQDGGGKNDDHIGENGWKGQVVIRNIDTTLSGAWNKALEIGQALLTIDHPVYDVRADIRQPMSLPVEKLNDISVYTAGLLIELEIRLK